MQNSPPPITHVTYTLHRGNYVQVGSDMQIKAQCRSGPKDASIVYVNAVDGFSEYNMKPNSCVDLGEYGNVTARGTSEGKVRVRFTSPRNVRILLGRDSDQMEDVLDRWRTRQDVG